jgi:hypothetical protein
MHADYPVPLTSDWSNLIIFPHSSIDAEKFFQPPQTVTLPTLNVLPLVFQHLSHFW